MALEVITRRPDGEAHPTPILCVHGILHGAWCYDTFYLPYLAQQGFVASALSLRGHGNSPIEGSLRWASLNQYVEDVNTVATELAATYGRRPIIVGHSMGGIITQKYCERYEAPGAVLLASVPHYGVIFAVLRTIRHDVWAFLQSIGQLKLSPLIKTIEGTRWAFFHPDMPDEEVASYQSRMGEESFRAFNDMIALSLPRPKRVKTPMLVIGAELDTLIGVREQERLARAYGADLHILADTAHDIMLEARWRESADLLVDWVRTKGL